MMNLREIHDRAKCLATDMIMSSGIGNLPPVVVGFDADDVPSVIQFEMPADPRARDFLAEALGKLLRSAGCTRAVFISETWISGLANKMATDSKGKILATPSEQPDRRDGIIIAAMEPGRVIHVQFEVRVSEEAPHLVELVQSGAEMDTATDKGTVSGRFANLLGGNNTIN